MFPRVFIALWNFDCWCAPKKLELSCQSSGHVTTPDIQTLSHPMSDWRHLLQVLRQVHVSIKNENKNEQNCAKLEQNSTKRVTRTRNTFLAEIQFKNSNWGTFAAYRKMFWAGNRATSWCWEIHPNSTKIRGVALISISYLGSDLVAALSGLDVNNFPHFVTFLEMFNL